MIRSTRHSVKFYEDEAVLLESVSSMIAAGLHAQETLLVVTTSRHREQLEKSVAASSSMPSRGSLLFHDANEVLSKVMIDGSPSESVFLEVFEGIIARAAQHSTVRVFGEMVAVLWEERRFKAALRMEALWNMLAAKHPFSLLCAYPIAAFVNGDHNQGFLDICGAHNHIIVTTASSTI